MSINFKEQVNSLETRIKIHDTYGSKNIDKWMLNKLNLKNKKSILDLGCGDGKQIIAINSILKNRYKNKKKYYFNLRAIIKYQRSELSLKKIYNIKRDSYSYENFFFSHIIDI